MDLVHHSSASCARAASALGGRGLRSSAAAAGAQKVRLLDDASLARASASCYNSPAAASTTKDGMYKGDARHYYKVASPPARIEGPSRAPTKVVSTILDRCGYGRVMRFSCAAFRSARDGCEIAARRGFLRQRFRRRTRRLLADIDSFLGAQFDRLVRLVVTPSPPNPSTPSSNSSAPPRARRPRPSHARRLRRPAVPTKISTTLTDEQICTHHRRYAATASPTPTTQTAELRTDHLPAWVREQGAGSAHSRGLLKSADGRASGV